ncbi:MAG: tail fiber protein [Burkholderia sp.]
MSEPYIGEIRTVAFDFAPPGWAFCRGQLMSIAQYTPLFALLGTNFGGNGVSTFGLPDLAGRSPIGTGTGPGLAPVSIGQNSGAETVTLLVSQMPAHNHQAVVSAPGAAHASIAVPVTTDTTNPVAVPANNTIPGPGLASGHAATVYSTSAATSTLKPFDAAVAFTANPTVMIGVSGSNAPVNIRNPYLGLSFIIALEGIFPSRG